GTAEKPPSSRTPTPTGRTRRPPERWSTVSACCTTSHGRRRGSANTIAPSAIRSVRAAAAARIPHGSNVSTGIERRLSPSHEKKPSQPASSAPTAMSSTCLAEPKLPTTPTLNLVVSAMPATLRPATHTAERTGRWCRGAGTGRRGRSAAGQRHDVEADDPAARDVGDHEAVTGDVDVITHDREAAELREDVPGDGLVRAVGQLDAGPPGEPLDRLTGGDARRT